MMGEDEEYDSAWQEGYDYGHDEGYEEGFEAGKKAAQAKFEEDQRAKGATKKRGRVA